MKALMDLIARLEREAREHAEGARSATGITAAFLRGQAQGLRDACFPLRAVLGISKVADLSAASLPESPERPAIRPELATTEAGAARVGAALWRLTHGERLYFSARRQLERDLGLPEFSADSIDDTETDHG